jgi:hypothetical protein
MEDSEIQIDNKEYVVAWVVVLGETTRHLLTIGDSIATNNYLLGKLRNKIFFLKKKH